MALPPVSLNTSGKITTIAVSTINTVPNTVFTGQVTAGSALIGTPSAYGDTWAYFGHKTLAINGTEYALLSENIGNTLLNAKSGGVVSIRNGNADIMTLNNTTATMYKPLDMNNCNINNVLNQYFTYGGSIQAQLGGTGGQQGILNINYPAAGTGHTNDGITYIWGGSASGNRYINLDSTNIGITVPLGAGNLWLNANTIIVGSLNMYSNSICNVSNITGSGELPITAAAGCNVNLTGTYINLIANNVQFSSNFAMNSGTTAGVYNLNVQNGLNMYSNNISNVSNINFATGGSISNVNTIRTTAISTTTISTNAIMAYNISSYSITANEGTISNLSSEFCSAYVGYFSTLDAGTVSSITVNTDTLVVGGTQYGRLPIQSNATQLSNATTIITTPNTSYLFDDYYNLTNYITISNYGFQNGDFINIVNTGNSGTPATFNVLDGSANPSTLIRYVYPGHAGVIVYSANNWWPM